MASGAISLKRSSVGCRPEIYLGCYPVIGYTLALIGLIVFGLLAFNVIDHGPLLRWDVPIDQSLHQMALHDSWLVVHIMIGASFMGREMIVMAGVLMAAYFWSRSRWRELWMLALGVGGGEIWFEVLSNIIKRPRPAFAEHISNVLTGPGFPSGHCISSVLLYGLIAYLLVPHLKSTILKVLVILAAVLLIGFIGYSRLFVGDHYLTDVIAGYAWGLFWGSLVYTSVELYYRRRRTKGA